MNILYIGPLMYGGTCLQRMWALQNLGYAVTGIDTGVPSTLPGCLRICFRIRRRLFANTETNRINREVLASARLVSPDLVWIDKGLTIAAETLRELKSQTPGRRIVAFSPDDMMNPSNQSENYLASVPLYDHHITTKSYNVRELMDLGARDVIMIDNAYCPRSHKPISLSQEERRKLGGKVGFIGYWEKEREEYLAYLAGNGIPIRIWGPWKRSRRYPSSMTIEGRVAWGDDYAPTICSFDINLNFLRKENRDLQTTRSVEIPACGAFMLAERSAEHLSLFKEGVEAEFFGDKRELLDKVNYYMSHNDDRERIASAGYLRCVEGGYSYQERLKGAMDRILRSIPAMPKDSK